MRYFDIMKNRIRFIIVGSGWRSLYYVRIAKALPQVFELCAMLCRTGEKAARMAEENGIHTTTSVSECISYKPDFVVVVVNKASIAEVALQWLDRGFCVLSETPAALDTGTLARLREAERRGAENGAKLVVCEQYRRYPSLSALLTIAKSGILGEPTCLNLSVAHEYHGASLMRAFLDIKGFENFTVRAKTYEFPTTETLTRYDLFKDGRVAPKKRTVATFEFESGKVGIYDFDSEQYRSPIRRNTIRLQGVRGEIIDDKVYYLDGNNDGVVSSVIFKSKIVHTESNNPNLSSFKEIQDIVFEGKSIYNPPFGLCGLSEDETAIASMMQQTALYARGQKDSPYPLDEAVFDAYMAIVLQRAVESGKTEVSDFREIGL